MFITVVHTKFHIRISVVH